MHNLSLERPTAYVLVHLWPVVHFENPSSRALGFLALREPIISYIIGADVLRATFVLTDTEEQIASCFSPAMEIWKLLSDDRPDARTGGGVVSTAPNKPRDPPLLVTLPDGRPESFVPIRVYS